MPHIMSSLLKLDAHNRSNLFLIGKITMAQVKRSEMNVVSPRY